MGAVQNHIWCLFAAFLWLTPPPITTAYMQSRPQCSSMYTIHDTICTTSTICGAKQIRVQNCTLPSFSSLLPRVIYYKGCSCWMIAFVTCNLNQHQLCIVVSSELQCNALYFQIISVSKISVYCKSSI